MTLEEARQFIWMFHRNKATIEIAEVRQEGDETYAVDVVRVDGTEQLEIGIGPDDAGCNYHNSEF
jgi:hypothetical protein